MDKLKELIAIVNRNKVKSIDVLGKSSRGDTLLNKFYDAIHDQKILTDDEALKFLYGNTSDKKAYYKLKHTLKDRLLSTLLLVDVKENKYSDRSRAYLESHKGMMALSFIVNAGIARKTAIWLAKKLLKTAIYWRFTEFVISAARTLRSFHASKSGDRKKFEQYDQIAKDYLELYTVELRAESLYSDILSYYVNDKSTKTFIYDLANEYILELEGLHPKVMSAKLYYQKDMLEIAKYMSVNDYQTTKVLCNKALDNLFSLDYQDNKAIVTISYQLIVCCIQLKEYNEGKKHIDIILSIQDPDTFNWFKAHELYMSLCFHTKQYSKAWEIYHNISKHKKFRHLPANITEVWEIYQAWLFLLFKMGKIDPEVSKDYVVKNFRVARFVNDMNIYSKDKKGLNIPILVIYILLLLHKKNYAILIDREEAMAKYVYRYIKRKDNERSNNFIKMLLEIFKHDFDPTKIQAKTEKYLAKMEQIPIDLSNQSHEVEILPYEDTWQLILELLKG